MNIKFSDNSLTARFQDYMNQYLSEVQGRKGFAYDASVTLKEKESAIGVQILDEISKLAGTSLSMEGVDPIYMASQPTVSWASFAVMNTLIDTYVPDVVDNSIGFFTETKSAGFGDDFRFDIESNDLFFVGVAGRNQRTTEFQRASGATTYVTPINHEISVAVNMYRAICGLDSLAKFVTKAILSIETAVTTEVYTALNTAMGTLPTDANSKFRIAAAGGTVDKNAAMELVQLVEAYNGGSKAIFVGTKSALSHLVPAADSGFRYTSPEIAYYQTVWGTDTMEIRQVASFNDKYKLKLDNSKIYVISPATDKLVKLCYEGVTTTSSLPASQTANKTDSTTLEKSWGVAIATGSVAGVITLA